MNYKRVVEETVTKFILNTCQLRPQLSDSALQAAMTCVRVAATRPCNNPMWRCIAVASNDAEEADYIPLTTGSVAEFYIEPMLPHVGDIDVMYHFSSQLAIPRGHPPPTSYQLSFTTMSRYLRLLTVTYLAMCTYRHVTY